MKYDIKGILIGSSILIGVIAIIAITIYLIRNKANSNTVLLPQQTDWGKTLTQEESTQITSIAEQLYKDMKGLNIFSRNHDIYTIYNQTTDRVFVSVANYFAQKYGNGETLAQWLKDENFAWLSFQTKGTVTAIIQRLATFGIN